VAAGMGGKPVTIRTFDLGADKHKEGLDGWPASPRTRHLACARSGSASPSHGSS
jgi:hypothetical protein